MSWLYSDVIPLFKKSDAANASNYRPISLLSSCSKLMESIINDSIVTYLRTNGLIHANQHGFVSKKSTTTQLLECMYEWTMALDQSIPVDIVYIDFAKAFDTVSHSKLIYKLSKSGIQGTLLKWIAAFLSNRKFRVKLNDSFSQFRNVTSGVPQGSIFGPTLFLLYLNDVVSQFSSVQCKMFADDVKLFVRLNDIMTLCLLAPNYKTP